MAKSARGGDRDSDSRGCLRGACHSEIANYRRELAILGIVRASDTHPLRNAQISCPCARFDVNKLPRNYVF